MLVPVVDSLKRPLMPCHPMRARALVRSKKAVRRFNKGIFYVQLTERDEGETQLVVVGIDPGSKREGFTVKSESHTYLNIQANAVTWVKKAVKDRSVMRRTRRQRKTPYRKCRWNRSRSKGFLAPSTKARWQWKLRICNWLAKLYPVQQFVVEDIKATTKKGQRRWNRSFSPLQVGKNWFYTELDKLAPVETRQGYETKELRDNVGLKKTSSKLSNKFEAHCVDSWVLANWYSGGHILPDNKQIVFIKPIMFHRRKLHVFQPSKGGIRKPYGGTRSLGFKRGSLVKHLKYGLVYVGGFLKDRICLHSFETGKRLCQNAKVGDCTFLAYNSWKLSWKTT